MLQGMDMKSETGKEKAWPQALDARDHLEELRRESRELDTLINDTARLFALSEVEEMVSFANGRILDRFVPSHLAFLIELPDHSGLKAYAFSNLKPEEKDFPLRDIGPFRDYFTASPHTASFSEIRASQGSGIFGEGLESFETNLVVPMLGIGGLFGIVLLGNKASGGDYTGLERMYADRLIRFLSICIQNRLHQEGSITDSKTGLYNYNYFMRCLDGEIARVGRGKGNSGVLMLDIDNFKLFNDTWGHLAGDEALAGLAKALKRSIRSEDVAARYGGEEFCVLLVDCGKEKLFEVAERIRLSVEGMRIKHKGGQLSVTVSLGACNLDPSWRGDSVSLMERADKALYLSKSGGRNRTTLYSFGLLHRASACLGNPGRASGT